MMIKISLSLLFTLCILSVQAQVKEGSVIFYNVENLFDTLDTADKNDAEFLPSGKKKWDAKKYNKKIANINKYIALFDQPVLIGLCEIENKQVVQDIVNSGGMKETHAVVHTESLDMRGIDNAIIYDSTILTLLENGVVRFDLPEGSRPTRDIVWAKFCKDKEIIYAMVNHWPSRYGGAEKSEPKRLVAAKNATEFIDSIMNADKKAQIIFMGDLNDHPDNAAPQLISESLTPMITAESGVHKGTSSYRGEWGILDHIMVSKNMFKKKGVYTAKDSGKIADNEYLLTEYKGNIVPFRTYGGGKYLDGYSDHLPVHITLKFK
ncbi:MAG: hypothetical protein HRT57_02660 [Crocinitomicaceae bacterium]|nr:hypothetical protein [Crocinitomicaceae bacterium]